MAITSRSRAIAAQPQAIWDVLADFGALSSWAEGVDHSCLLNDRPGGAALGITRRVQIGRNTVVERITEFDPPAAVAYDIEGMPKRLGKLANRWTLEPTSNGTRATITSTVESGSGPLAAALEWVIGRGMAKQSESLLAGLASRTEHT